MFEDNVQACKHTKDKAYGITRVEYIPQYAGRQFDMYDVCIFKYFVPGEMTYQMMMTIQLLNALNDYRKPLSQCGITLGALEGERHNMLVARALYDSAKGKHRIFKFVSAYNRMNRHPMVIFPKGMHHDHFSENEPIKNKNHVVISAQK